MRCLHFTSQNQVSTEPGKTSSELTKYKAQYNLCAINRACIPEAKFEWDKGRSHIGGGYDTNLHLTRLLLMKFGLKKAVRMLLAKAWNGLL